MFIVYSLKFIDDYKNRRKTSDISIIDHVSVIIYPGKYTGESSC